MASKTLHTFYLAPFQGITTHVFREVYTRHFSGVSKLYTAFFTGIQTAKSMRRWGKELKNIRHHNIPVVPQILSKDADEILLFARLCRNLGFEEVNWNLGCPFPRVAKKMRGSGLLPHPDKVNAILEKVMPDMPVRFSVKCRLGYYHAEEIFELLPVLNRFPLSELIVHARLGVQMYKGHPLRETFSKLPAQTVLPLAYNGDIFSPEDFETAKNNFPQTTRWMLGRGLLADPFLPALLQGETLPEVPQVRVRRYVEDLYVAYRKNFNDSLRAINVMKELWSYLALSFDDPGKVFGKIKKTNGFDAYEEAVNTIFENFTWMGNGAIRLRDEPVV